jgi:hypothetical protein
VSERTEEAERRPDRISEVSRGQEAWEEEPHSESPNGIRKDLKAGKRGHKSHDRRAAEKAAKTDLLLERRE